MANPYITTTITLLGHAMACPNTMIYHHHNPTIANLPNPFPVRFQPLSTNTNRRLNDGATKIITHILNGNPVFTIILFVMNVHTTVSSITFKTTLLIGIMIPYIRFKIISVKSFFCIHYYFIVYFCIRN